MGLSVGNLREGTRDGGLVHCTLASTLLYCCCSCVAAFVIALSLCACCLLCPVSTTIRASSSTYLSIDFVSCRSAHKSMSTASSLMLLDWLKQAAAAATLVADDGVEHEE